MLFTTSTCPNCKIAKAMLDKAGIKYQQINVDENKDIAIAYGISKAPTLLVPDNNNGYISYDNASLIRKYINDQNLSV